MIITRERFMRKMENEIQARYYWNYVLNLKKTELQLKQKIETKLITGL